MSRTAIWRSKNGPSRKPQWTIEAKKRAEFIRRKNYGTGGLPNKQNRGAVSLPRFTCLENDNGEKRP